MKLIIEIDEEIYKSIKIGMRNRDDMAEIGKAVENGTPIHNVTNGDIVMAFFPNEHDFETDFDATWWNAPYQKGGKE